MAHEAENQDRTAPPREIANPPAGESPVGTRVPSRLELATSVSRIEESIEEIRWELNQLRRSLGNSKADTMAVQTQAVALARRLDPVEAQVRAIKRAAVPTERLSPVPEDPDHPTEPEARRIILDQLYKNEYWGGRHTSGEHFCRGYLAKCPRGWVLGIVKKLVRDGLLLPHGKSSDEHYSLNRAKANEIYDELGIPPRDSRPDTPTERLEAPTTTSNKKCPKDVDGVSQGTFLNTVRTLRERLESLEASGSASAQQICRLETQVAKLKAHINELEQAERSRAAAEVASPPSPPDFPPDTQPGEPAGEDGS